MVAAAFFILLVSMGPHMSFGLFLNPIIAEFSWTRAMTSGAFSLSMLTYGLLGIVMGRLTDRYGPRLVVTICGVLMGLGYLLASTVGNLWQLYLYLGLIVGIGTSGAWVPQMSSIARWFVKKRSLMTGIIIAGASISGLIAPPIISRLIHHYDWHQTFLMLGSAISIVVILTAQFLRRDPTKMGQRPYGMDEVQQDVQLDTNALDFREAVRTVQFWLTFAILFCGGFIINSVMIHVVPHAIDLDIADITAANILSFVGGANAAGNYILGSVADRIGNRRIIVLCFVVMMASLFWLMISSKLWMFYLFAIAFGLSFGGLGAIQSPLVAGLFGLSSHGVIYGVIYSGFTVGAAIGPYISAYIYDLTDSYQVAFLTCAAISIAGIILTMVLRPIKRISGRI